MLFLWDFRFVFFPIGSLCGRVGGNITSRNRHLLLLTYYKMQFTKIPQFYSGDDKIKTNSLKYVASFFYSRINFDRCICVLCLIIRWYSPISSSLVILIWWCMCIYSWKQFWFFNRRLLYTTGTVVGMVAWSVGRCFVPRSTPATPNKRWQFRSFFFFLLAQQEVEGGKRLGSG